MIDLNLLEEHRKDFENVSKDYLKKLGNELNSGSENNDIEVYWPTEPLEKSYDVSFVFDADAAFDPDESKSLLAEYDSVNFDVVHTVQSIYMSVDVPSPQSLKLNKSKHSSMSVRYLSQSLSWYRIDSLNGQKDLSKAA